MYRPLLLLLTLALLVSAGCDSKKKEIDTPAGHPDELRDSTRLDPAPSTDTAQVEPGAPKDTASGSAEAPQPKKRPLRFRSPS